MRYRWLIQHYSTQRRLPWTAEYTHFAKYDTPAGWLDEWGHLKGGRLLSLGVALKRAFIDSSELVRLFNQSLEEISKHCAVTLGCSVPLL